MKSPGPARTAFIFAAVFSALIVPASRVPFDLTATAENVSLLVQIDFPGAFEAEVERTLAVPLENALADMPGVTGMVSVSERDRVRMHLRFSDETDGTEACLGVRDRIFSLEHRFPPGARRPVISRGDPGDRPVFTAAFPPDVRLSEDEMRRIFEAVEGSGEVTVSGGIRREIRVRVDPAERTDFFSVPGAVRNAAASGTFGRPGGAVLRMGGRPRSAEEVKKIRLGPGTELGDAASVELAAAERTGTARLDGGEVLLLSVRRAGDADTAALCRRLRLLAESFPGAVVLHDRRDRVREEFLRILLPACMGTALAGMLAAVHLRRPAAVFTVLLNVPFSAAAALAALAAAGIGLDPMSMSGIAAGSGMVVSRGLLTAGRFSRGEEGRDGKTERNAAVLSALTSAAAFFPLFFARPGPVRLLAGFAAASSVQIAASLVFVFLFQGPLLSGLGPLFPAAPRLPTLPAGPFPAPLRAAFGAPASRRAATAALLVLPCAAAFLVPRGNASPGGELSGGDFLSFTVEFELGRPLPLTEAAVRPLEKRLIGLDGVLRVWTLNEREKARFDVRLADPSFRKPVRAAVRDFSETLPDGFIHFPEDMSAAGSFEVLVTGPDMKTLKRTAAGLAGEIGGLPGVRDVVLHYKEAPSAKVVTFDPAAARNLGVAPADAAERLYWALSGPVAEKIFIGDREIDLRVFSVPRAADTAAGILAFPVPAAGGAVVRIGDFARMEEKEQCGRITRTNRSRSVSFTVLTEDGNPPGPRQAARRAAAAYPFPPGYTAAVAENGRRENEALRGLAATFLLAFPLAALLLAFHYENFRGPLFVLVQTPACAAAALLPSLLRGSPCGALTALGTALSWGPVVMNSLLALPRRNPLPRADEPGYSARIFRTVAAASLAPLAGALPLAFSGNEAAPLAEALAAGTAAAPFALAAAAAVFFPRPLYPGSTGPRRPGRFSGLPLLPGRRRPHRRLGL